MVDVLNELAEYFTKALKSELKRPYQSKSYAGMVKTIGGTPVPASPKFASGTLYNSVNVRVDETPDGASLVLDFGAAANYAYYVEYGRKPGKFPPLRVIDRWVVQKGIGGIRDEKGKFMKRKSLVYLVRRSIAEHGIGGIHFIDNALEKSMERIIEKYGEYVELQILEYLRNTGLFVEYGTETNNNLTRVRVI